MTVEETPLPQVHTGQPRSRDETLKLTLAKVREVTGASDDIIEEAIRACSCKDGTFKVEDVVTTIIGDDTVATVTSPKTRKPQAQTLDDVDAKAGSPSSSSSAPSVAGGNQTGQAGQRKVTSATGWKQGTDASDYIDLTRDPQGILGGQISREEQDISRVLEASLAESKGSTKRKRGELWFTDPLNPHERKRTDGWPVGLRNVGNTCWFSAVIQSLFHIQKFRSIVLNYKSRPLAENESNHKLRFVCELRQLFGLMVGSHRKYVDPSMAVNILKEASSATALDGQQDVSEFQHKLLDWLEDAFSVPHTSSSESAAAPNPVHQLFQGKYKAEGFNQGKAFTQEVTFGQYPLNVLGFRDIHESLEATTAQGEIETVSGDSSHKSGQEIWFTHLPVVLTFELSRFGFNQQLNRAEKIHQELSFPPVIYVDRYLECNKSVTRQKREEARKLKEELAALQARLDRFMNYGSNSKRYPLPDVLQYALEFAETSPSARRVAAVPASPVGSGTGASELADVEMRSPGPSSRDCQDVSMSSVGEDQSSASIAPTSTAVTTTAAAPNTTVQLGTAENSAGLQAMPPAALSSSSSSSSSSHPHPVVDSINPESSSPHQPKVPYTTASLATSLSSSKSLSSSSSSPSCYCTPLSPSPAPEAKKFKDSSVQVEFDAGQLMPNVAMATAHNNPPAPNTNSQSLAQSLFSSLPSSLPTVAAADPSNLQNPTTSYSTSLSLTMSPAVVAPSTCLTLAPTGGPHTPTSCALLPVPPHPRTCSAEELVVLQGCLRRWREEVEADVRELQRNISSLEGKLDGMYSEEHMKKYPYHLHAVLVHEGQAVSGHYWSFIHDWQHHHQSSSNTSDSGSSSKNSGDCSSGSEGRWLKFNDITVSECSLAEVQREGIGGHHNASAYCLMYIDRSRLEAGQGDANSSATSAPSLTSVPEDLQRAVDEDNHLFRQEMLQWDAEQRRKASGSTPAATHSSPSHPGSSPTSNSPAASRGLLSSPSSSHSSGGGGAGGGGSKSTSTSTMTTQQPAQSGAVGSREGGVKGQGRTRSASGDPDVVMTGEQRPGESSITRPMNPGLASLADAHAQLSLQATLTAVSDMHVRGNNSGGKNLLPQVLFKGAMERELMRLKGLSRTVATRLPAEDPRLNHIVLYLLTSGADSRTVQLVLAEQFALCGLLDSASTVKGVRHEAQEFYKALYVHGGTEGVKCYEFWHKRYHHYRQAVYMFTEGVTAYTANKYQEALPYFNQACLHNSEPGLTSSLHPTDGLNAAWLAYYRRGTLQQVNEQALKSFERDEDLSDALTVMTQQILPTLAMVGGSDLTEDQALVEGIRGIWCQFLEKDLTENKVEKLQDFLSKMFESGGSRLDELHRVRPSLLDTLADHYTRVMRRLKETGDLAVLMSLSS